jgi:hypothetical protein
MARVLEAGLVIEIAATAERFEQPVNSPAPSEVTTEILDLHPADIEHHL